MNEFSVQNGGIPNLDSKKIGETIRRLRRAHGLSQEKLAAIVEVDTRTIGRWERNDTDISQATLVTIYRVSRVFGVTIETILAD